MFVWIVFSATKPLSGGESVKRSVQHNFKTAPDGRFIIKEDDDEEEEEQPQSREDMQQDVDDLLDAMGGYKRVCLKLLKPLSLSPSLPPSPTPLPKLPNCLSQSYDTS